MSIKNAKFLVFPCLLSSFFVSAQAADALIGWGRVNMQGAIIDTACAIAVASREQTIDMGLVPLDEIERNGQGRSKPLAIDLVNCTTNRPGKVDWKQFQVTFDGEADGDGFSIHGTAAGVALQITDTVGNIALPGTALPIMAVTPGERQLNYTLRLIANRHALKSGDYFSAIRFKLDYF